MQAITTAFLCPTNHRGSRVKASCQAGSIVLNWDHALNQADNHRAAALKLAQKFGWRGRWFGGAEFKTSGYVFVCADPDYSPNFTIEKETVAA